MRTFHFYRHILILRYANKLNQFKLEGIDLFSRSDYLKLVESQTLHEHVKNIGFEEAHIKRTTNQ